MKTKQQKRQIRQRRIRSKVAGTAERPRLAVFKSNQCIYAQLIDDVAGKTLVSASDLKLKNGNKVKRAETVGQELAKTAIAKKIKSVVFDRGGYKYVGRVRSLAEGARTAGLEF